MCRPNLVNAAKTAMSSKILGPESSFFAEMAVDAVTAVRTESGGDLGKKARKHVDLVVRGAVEEPLGFPTACCRMLSRVSPLTLGLLSLVPYIYIYVSEAAWWFDIMLSFTHCCRILPSLFLV